MSINWRNKNYGWTNGTHAHPPERNSTRTFAINVADNTPSLVSGVGYSEIGAQRVLRGKE